MDFDVRDFGAVGDALTCNTQSIQSAIDQCNLQGGGRVVLSNGIYMTGSIVLKSNVELRIEAGATLLGSALCSDYPEKEGLAHVISENLPRRRNASLIFAENAENISITGLGKIDCNGKSFVEKRWGSGVRGNISELMRRLRREWCFLQDAVTFGLRTLPWSTSLRGGAIGSTIAIL